MEMEKDRHKIRDDLLTDCERSKRYHSARLRFYESAHRWILLFIVVCGASSITTWTNIYAATLPAIAAAFGLVSLVFDLSGKARLHESLYQRFAFLNGRIESVSNPHQKDLDMWLREIHDIYADEPPIYRALHKYCYNQVLEALYEKDTKEYQRYFAPMKWYQHWLMNFIRFSRISG